MDKSPGLTVGSLFSGIGGLDLGLERAGMNVIWQSEIDPYASKVLEKHWPAVPNLGNIKEIDWSTVERPDVICGGYPCQPFSLAGGRKGTDDERHLWPYFADAIRVLRPRFALLENVPGHLSLGFGDVHADLAELGYDTEWECIPAAAVGAPHLRWRIFVVAHTECFGRDGNDGVSSSGIGEFRDDARGDSGAICPMAGAVPNPDGRRRSIEWEFGVFDGERSTLRDDAHGRRGTGNLGNADSTSPDTFPEAGRPRGAVSQSSWWEVEPDVGRVADGIPSRVDRLRCLGNAVVPQVAEFVGRRIMELQNA